MVDGITYAPKLGKSGSKTFTATPDITYYGAIEIGPEYGYVNGTATEYSQALAEVCQNLGVGESVNINGLVLTKKELGGKTVIMIGIDKTKLDDNPKLKDALKELQGKKEKLDCVLNILFGEGNKAAIIAALAKLDTVSDKLDAKKLEDALKKITANPAQAEQAADTYIASLSKPAPGAGIGTTALTPGAAAAGTPAPVAGTAATAPPMDASAKADAWNKFLALSGSTATSVKQEVADNGITRDELREILGHDVSDALWNALSHGLHNLTASDGTISYEDLRDAVATIGWLKDKMGITDVQAWALYQGGLKEMTKADFEAKHTATITGLKATYATPTGDTTVTAWIDSTNLSDANKQALKEYAAKMGIDLNSKAADSYGKLIQMIIAMAYASRIDKGNRIALFGITTEIHEFKGDLSTGNIIAWLTGKSVAQTPGREALGEKQTIVAPRADAGLASGSSRA